MGVGFFQTIIQSAHKAAATKRPSFISVSESTESNEIDPRFSKTKYRVISGPRVPDKLSYRVARAAAAGDLAASTMP